MRREAKAMRQGDVLLMPRSADSRQKDRSRFRRIEPVDGRLILAEGEQTGHHHSVAARPNIVLMTDGIDTILDVQGRATKLAHQEHSAHTVVADEYDVILQRRVLPSSTTHRVVQVYD